MKTDVFPNQIYSLKAKILNFAFSLESIKELSKMLSLGSAISKILV